jgi:hypothetical protein
MWCKYHAINNQWPLLSATEECCLSTMCGNLSPESFIHIHGVASMQFAFFLGSFTSACLTCTCENGDAHYHWNVPPWPIAIDGNLRISK